MGMLPGPEDRRQLCRTAECATGFRRAEGQGAARFCALRGSAWELFRNRNRAGLTRSRAEGAGEVGPVWSGSIAGPAWVIPALRLTYSASIQ